MNYKLIIRDLDFGIVTNANGSEYHPRKSTDTPRPTLPITTRLPPLPREPDQPSDRFPTIHPDTPELPIPEPDPCKSEYDAIASIRQEIFIFKDKWFWRIRQDGVLSQSPRHINTLWKEAAWPVDAAVESDHQIYLFSGKDIYIFNGQRLVSKKTLTDLGLPASIERIRLKTLTDLGLPASIEHIRLVYTWNYWTEQPMYIWTNDEFWRVDKKSGKVEIAASPITTSQLWRFCPVAMKISSKGYVPHISLLSVIIIVIIAVFSH
ncbi:unnamed protein product [Onchocerca flexuosa]|uniref:Hemopexin n=1 Tax=Onchocerca flexuosa TaxID=387005 RepID=A0A183I3E3_9BILA|nr:unnamed protein product [Onchocerca flexuosa]